MNVFVLGTGRCGTTTFSKACSHSTNYTSGHETAAGELAVRRFPYPTRHIEADNRLSWMLGHLQEAYGDRAFYVHLTRSRAEVVRSFTKRGKTGIMKAYSRGILTLTSNGYTDEQCAEDMIDTVTANIACFLRDKPNKMQFLLEDWQKSFPEFWRMVGAEGDLDAAMNEWTVRYNPGNQKSSRQVLRRAKHGFMKTLGRE